MREDLYNYDYLLKGVFSTKARERIKKYISELLYRIGNLELQVSADNKALQDYREIISCIMFLNINLLELENLGLHRYNAKYGSQGKYITEVFYSVLKEKGIINPCYYKPKMIRRKTNE